MKQILVATDGSENARYAVDQALELARACEAKLLITYVRHAPLPVLGEPVFQRSLSRELRQAQEATRTAAELARGAGIEAEVEILEGNAGAHILELARSRDVDLVVVGSRGLGTVAGALLGSVSREIVHHADRPVLVATRRADRRRHAA